MTGDGTNATVLRTDADGDFGAEGGGLVDCGAATTANTSSIVFKARVRRATLELLTPLDATATEIDVTVEEAAGLTYSDGTARGTTIRTGVLPGRRVIDLNGDGDVDITQGRRPGPYGPYVASATIDAGAGRDSIDAGGGFAGSASEGSYTDVVQLGGTGDDRLTGPGTLHGQEGDDTLAYGIPGPFTNVSLRYDTATGPVRMKPDLSGTEPGFDGSSGTDFYVGMSDAAHGIAVIGSAFDDVLHGTSAKDQLLGRDGRDVLFGGDARDLLTGGYGADTLYGGPGPDVLDGSGDGGARRDEGNTLTGGPGTDVLRGAEGDDTFTDLEDAEPERVDCNFGADRGAPDRVDQLSYCPFAAPTVSVAGARVPEGSPLPFTVTLSRPVGITTSVRLTTSDGTGKDGTDYTATQQVVTFQPGDVAETVAVPTTPNALDDGARTLTATLDQPSPTPAIATASATGTIADDDPAPTIVLDPAAPDGPYTTPPAVTVTPPPLATETRCVTDPQDVPATFAAIPAGACRYTAPGGATVEAPGTHRVCAASRTSEPEETEVRCASWTLAAAPDQVVVDPAAGTGLDGWHRTPPTLRVVPVEDATETRCGLDPATTPATFDDLPAGTCEHVGTGRTVESDGAHVLCSASMVGTVANAVTCASWRTDATPPVVRCQPPPAFTVGQRGEVTVSATVTDPASGPVARVVSRRADTATVGVRAVDLAAADRAGNTTTATCRYSVDATKVVLCGQDVVLLEVIGARDRVRIGGVALARYAGEVVTVHAGGVEVGRTTVAPDGSFATSVRPPRRAQRSSVRYDARVGGARSQALKLERKLRITRRKGLLVTGRILAPRRSIPRTVTFYRQLTCTKKRIFRTVRLTRAGVFRIKLARPVAPEPYALFRVTAQVGKARTYTLPIAVR